LKSHALKNLPLKNAVISISESLGIDLKKDEIEACHRLPKGKSTAPKRSIVRLVNRKKANLLLKTSKRTRLASIMVIFTSTKTYVGNTKASGLMQKNKERQPDS